MDRSKLKFFTSFLLLAIFLIVQLQAIPFNDDERLRFNSDAFRGSQTSPHVPVRTMKTRLTGKIEQRSPYGYWPSRRMPFPVSNQLNQQNPTSTRDTKVSDDSSIHEREESLQKSDSVQIRPSSVQTWENPVTGEVEEYSTYGDWKTKRRPSQAFNQLHQENPMSEHEKKRNSKTYTEEWKQILQKINQQNDPFKNPPKFATFTESQKGIFIEHLNHTDILNIGEFNGKPMFTDLTNFVAEIKDEDPFYEEYLKVWQRHVATNKQTLDQAEARLSRRFNFVTIHPRYKSIFDLQNDIIFQERDTHNAIFSTHPHYPIYKEKYQITEIINNPVREEIKGHQVNSLGPISEFDPRLKLQDPYSEWASELILIPEDYEYSVFLEKYERQLEEDVEMEKLLSKNADITPAIAEIYPWKPAYNVKDFSNNPIFDTHRWHSRVQDAYNKMQDEKKKKEESEDKEKTFEPTKKEIVVTRCYERDLDLLCVEGHPEVRRINPGQEGYPSFFQIFVKLRREQREQVIIEEIPLHELGREEGKENEGPMYFDYTLEEGPFNSTHSRYIHYENTWNLLKELNDTKDARCLADLTCHKIDQEWTGHGFTYFDHDLNLKILPDDKRNHDYRLAYNEIQEVNEEEENPVLIYSGLWTTVEVIKQEGKLPKLKTGEKITEPGTRRWEVFRKAYLIDPLNNRKNSINWENRKLREYGVEPMPER